MTLVVVDDKRAGVQECPQNPIPLLDGISISVFIVWIVAVNVLDELIPFDDVIGIQAQCDGDDLRVIEAKGICGIRQIRCGPHIGINPPPIGPGEENLADPSSLNLSAIGA